jgi:hypothetical protein
MGSVAQNGDADGKADGSQAKAKRISAAASDDGKSADADAKSSKPGSVLPAKKAKVLKPDVVVEFQEWAGHKWEAYLRRQRHAAAKRAALRSAPGGGGSMAARVRGWTSGLRQGTAGSEGSSYKRRVSSDMGDADFLE